MNFNFDDLFYETGKYLDSVKRKTGEAFDYSKKQIEKAQLKAKFRDKLTELGKMCYDMHKTDIDHTGSMKRLLIELEDLEQQIKDADDVIGTPIVCSLCGTKNNPSNDYCTKCGEKLKR